ncbi:hypothetical protein T069G_03214 [Trichoderma breve]|uniref:NYN domain-containing protein n=1 Tax=Trichoderma breve TaxID=2034170 RepID=A0A9W9BL16_9HYPO|nr:hypothetical protein T069G_03214 [Trichoderma breve]KAJ4862260.1 hypothetical protein T069G_03214 [Trichoderma breve]
MIDPPGIHYIDRIETVDQSSNYDAASSSSYTPAKPIKLGDFSKLFVEFLDSPQHRYDPGPDLLERSDYDDDYSSAQIALKPASLSSTPSSYGPELSLPAKRPSTNIVRHDLPYLSPPACRHPSSQGCICGRGRRRVGQTDLLTSSSPECLECSPPSNTMHHSRSWMNKLPSNVREKLRLKDDRHRALMMNLVPYRVRDASMAEKHPTITSQGVHVFIDMSNIDIGYQRTLKGFRRLDENTRLSPVPHLNLQFLTKILVRDRPVVALNVCCSTLPGRSEPRYVQQLRELGYHVDLRERKGVIEGGLNFTGASDTLRFVEDLVDETLQVRIAESVMEYFLTPGTIVLATGDAKPSPHSDGFFSYVERALKMGWNVEVVSWRGNLSQRWIDRHWTSQWRDKFRVILLDEFLEVLK